MSVNSIVDVWPRYEIFCLSSLFFKLGTTRFCILPDGSYMFLKIKSRYVLKRLVLLARLLNIASSSSSSWRKNEEEEEKKNGGE